MMLPATYKKAMITHFSEDAHNALEIVETKMSAPAPNELLVRNIYAGANFMDVPRMMGLAKFYQDPPFDAGLDALGEVMQVGSDVKDFKVGDMVVTAFFGNGFREYSLIDHNLAATIQDPTPERLGLVISGSMASIVLEVVLGIKESTPRQKILVTAGIGDAGHFIVQLAKLGGHHVISSCGNAEEVALLKTLGCDRVINRDDEELAEVLISEYPNGVNVAIDSFGGHYFNTCLDSLAPKGHLISMGALVEHTRHEGQTHSIDIYNKLIWKSATLHGFNLIEYAQFIPYHSQKVRQLYEAGKIRTLIDPVHFKGIERVPDAVAHLTTWQTRGKVVVEL